MRIIEWLGDQTFAWWMLNLAYAVYALSGTFRNMLRLRVVLFVASIAYMTYGVAAGIWSVFWWNVPVLVLHGYHIVDLMQARRQIDLDDESRGVHQLLFPDLDEVTFNAMWQCGEERKPPAGEILITQHSNVESLLLILDGDVDVGVSDALTIRLGRYRFVGEMSMLKGGAASATVTARDGVRLRTWDKDHLEERTKKFPDIQLSLLRALGRDVANKVG